MPFARRTLPLLLLSLFVFALTVVPAAERKSRSTKSAAVDKKRADSKPSNKKETASAKKREKSNEREAKRDSDKRKSDDKRQLAKGDSKKSESKKSDRRGDDKKDSDSSKSAGSKAARRERLAEARREAARREAERREEEARRAEIARQARLAAIARARAAEQALRDDTVANIAKDDTTGEDLEVRRAAVNALGNLAGSVVVIDPMTGRVFTVVNQEWGVRRGFKPCSTIKLVTGLAGIEDKIISPNETVAAWNGRYRLDLTDSLAYSNNAYFQRVGGAVGFDRMMAMAREIGLGQPTGINHARESAGRVPLFKTGYAVNHMSSHGDDFKVTPIQLATMAAAIANGGNLLIPHLPRTPEENQYFRTEMRRRLNIQPESLRRVVPGMIGAVNYGSGRQAFDQTQTIGGKTGSCIDDGQWVGLFTSYAPVDDPRLAVAVVIKGSGARGKVAAGVAGRVYRALNNRFGRRAGAPSQLAISPAQLAPRPKLDAAAARLVSDEDLEAEAAAVDTNSTGNADAGGATRGVVQKVIKTTPATRPVETTTRPAAPQSMSPAPRTGAQNAIPNERPRRVLSTSP
jgi:membrane peptidoglycan carboxypeptidase